MNIRPYSDNIGKYQTYHDFMNRKDLDLNQLYEQSPRYVQNNITPNTGDGDIIPEHIINNQQDGDVITDNTIDFINQHPYIAATAGIAGLGALGYGIRKATKRMPVKTASWEDGFTEHELEKIANNVSRIVNDHFDAKESRDNGKGRYSEEKANKYFNMSDSSREKYKAMKKKQDNAYRNLFTVDRAVNAFNTSKDKKETEYAKDLILKNTGRIGTTIPIKKNWLGKVTRYGISPGVVNNVK